MKNRLPLTVDIYSLLDAAPDALIIVNQAGRIIHINTQTEKLFGYSFVELVGQTVEYVMPERYRHNHAAHRHRYFNHPQVRPMGAGFELYGLKKNGEEFSIEISLSPLEADGETFTLAAVRDITGRKCFEVALQEKNLELEKANLAKDNFLASMSHELRTPLNAIIGFTGTLLMKIPGPITPDQEKQLTTVRRGAEHLLSLINDLLDLAKITSGKVELKFEEVNCQDLIEEVMNTLRPQAQKKQLDFSSHVPLEPLTIKSDRRSLNQILINLTNNAIKFTSIGNVCLELSEYQKNDFPFIKIAVIDTGIGIKSEDEKQLFNAFQQVHNSQRVEGTGLGLHLSQKLALLLGGAIECKSEFGKGSCFTLVVPQSREEIK